MSSLNEAVTKIVCVPISALSGLRSKSAEEAKVRQIRHELQMTPEDRVALALQLGRRQIRL